MDWKVVKNFLLRAVAKKKSTILRFIAIIKLLKAGANQISKKLQMVLKMMALKIKANWNLWQKRLQPEFRKTWTQLSRKTIKIRIKQTLIILIVRKTMKIRALSLPNLRMNIQFKSLKLSILLGKRTNLILRKKQITGMNLVLKIGNVVCIDNIGTKLKSHRKRDITDLIYMAILQLILRLIRLCQMTILKIPSVLKRKFLIKFLDKT